MTNARCVQLDEIRASHHQVLALDRLHKKIRSRLVSAIFFAVLAVNITFLTQIALPTALLTYGPTLSFSSNLDAMNRVVELGQLNSVSRPVSTLDEICQKSEPQIIKIDVEGHELPVLRGGGRFFGRRVCAR